MMIFVRDKPNLYNLQLFWGEVKQALKSSGSLEGFNFTAPNPDLNRD